MILLYLLIAALVILICGLWFAYHTAFRRDPRRQADMHEIPDDVQYVMHRDLMTENIKKLAAQPYERICVRSHDGLELVGKYYAGQPGKPVILFFHGYRSTGERDASGAFWYCRECGYSMLMVDQRAHGESEGRTISFGIKERYDCLTWVNEILRRFGSETEILLSGISMGGATVLMASELDLPHQVKGIWADCGFASPEEVLRESIRRKNCSAVRKNALKCHYGNKNDPTKTVGSQCLTQLGFKNSVVFDTENLVALFDGRQAVGNNDHRLVSAQALD